MKKRRIGILILICVLLFSGCRGGVSLENGALVLLIGIDKSEKTSLLVGTSTTVFKGKKKEHTFEEIIRAPSIYHAFSKIMTKTTGYVTSSKAQVILVGKTFTTQPHWSKILDPIVRDPSSTSNIKLLVADGPITDFFTMKPPNNMSIPMYIKGISQSALYDNRMVPSNIQEFIRQKNEDGMTPTIPIIKKIKNKVQTTGIAFFNQTDKYITSLSVNDVPLYALLHQPKLQGRMILNLALSDSKERKPKMISILVENVKRKIDADCINKTFQFDINLNMEVAILERINGPTITKSEKQKKEIERLEKQITAVIHRKFKKITRQIQQNQIDPLGFSMYARAYQYPEWKRQRKNWGKAIYNSDIRLHINIHIQTTGIMRG